MRRFFRSLGFFLIGFCLIAAAEFSYADTIPATQESQPIQTAVSRPASTASNYPGVPATAIINGDYTPACNKHMSTYPITINNGSTYWTATLVACNSSYVKVHEKQFASSGSQQTEYDAAYTWTVVPISGSACPSGYTNTGTSCIRYTCPANYTLGQGADGSKVCTSNSPTCDSAVGTVLYSGWFDVGTSPSNVPPSTICKNHCVGIANLHGPDATSPVNGVKHYFYKGTPGYVVDSTGTAGYCATDTDASQIGSTGSNITTPSCPTGQQLGYISGVATCYTPGSNTTTPPTPPVTTQEGPQTTTNNPDGSTTKEQTSTHSDGSKTTTSTTCTASGSCTTTTTETPAPDAQAHAQFCDAHPTDPNCTKGKSECELHPDTVGCMLPGIAPDSEAIPSVSHDVGFAPFSFSHPAESCPAPKTANLRGHVIQVDYTPLCNYAGAIRPALLAFSYLAAIYLIVGGIKQES